MGEVLRRSFNAQLADRNTKDYDILVGREEEDHLYKLQVKTVRSAPWYVRASDFTGKMLDRITIYVLIGNERAAKPVRFFVTFNRDLANSPHHPPGWIGTGFIPLKAVEPFEEQWNKLNMIGHSPATKVVG